MKNTPGVGFDNPNTNLVATRTAALNAAAATFGSWFTQTATINVNVSDFNSGPLDSNAFPEVAVTGTNPGFVRTVPEVKVQDGTDLNGAAADAVLFLNWEEGNPDVQGVSPRWNYTDTIGANEMDFKGEIIHNLAHILGFQSRIEQAGEDIFNDPFVHLPGAPGTWLTYDKFLSSGSSASSPPLINRTDFRLNLPEWTTASTSGTSPTTGLFFQGPHAMAANGGNPVPLHSPTTFEFGATASHLRTSALINRSNTLMVAPAAGTQNTGPQARRFTPVEVGIMKDLGYQLDTTAPKPVLSTSQTSPTNLTTAFTVSANFGEAVLATFDLSDIQVTNGTASNLLLQGTAFTFTVTPNNSLANGTVTINIPANATSDFAGNSSLAADPLNIVIDTTPPAVTLSTQVTSPRNQTTAFQVTGTISEAIVGTFAPELITKTNATVSNLQRVGNNVTFDVTPTTTNGAISLSVGANVVSDAAGNGNVASNQLNIVIDAVRPTPVFVSPPTTSNESKVTLTVDFGETIGTTQTNPPVTVSGGTAANFSTVSLNGRPNSGFTFDVTPTTPTSTVVVSVPANVILDVAGNPNDAASPATINFGTTLPSRISGLVFADKDSDQTVDTDELRLGGVTVVLTGVTSQNQSIDRSSITLADGSYHFDNLPLGNYQVRLNANPILYTDSRTDIPGSLGDADGDNADGVFGVNITAPGTQAANYQFAMLDLQVGYRNVIDNLAGSNLRYNPQLGAGGLYAVQTANGSMDSVAIIDGFDGIRAAEVVLADDRRTAFLTIVTENFEVKTARIDRRGFVIVQAPPNHRLIRILGGLNDFSFTTINLAAPPIVAAPGYLDSIRAVFEQEGWGSIAPNPPSTVAPVIQVSTNGQSPVQLSVSASGSKASFDVTLNAPPVNGVVVLDVQSANINHVIVKEPLSQKLTFTSANWQIPQIVTVEGRDDGTPQVQNQLTAVQIAVNKTQTTATNYQSTLPQSVTVETVDDQTSTVVVTGPALAIATDESATAFYQTALPVTGSGIPVASGDVTGDGVADYVLGHVNFGGRPSVAIIDVARGQTRVLELPLTGFMSSIRVALADFDRDGVAEIVVGYDSGSVGFVQAFDARSGSSRFLIVTSLVGSGVVDVATGDVNGDGIPDIIVGSGPNVDPRIEFYDGQTRQHLRRFRAFEGLGFGVNLAVGDLDDDGIAEIVASEGPGGNQTKVFTPGGTLKSQFDSFSTVYRGGSSVAVDPRTNRIYLAALDGSGQVVAYSSTGAVLQTLQPFANSNLPGNNLPVPFYITVGNTQAPPRVPVPTISLLPGSTLQGGTAANVVTKDPRVTLMVDFGGLVNGFTASDLQIFGGTASAFTETNGRFRFDITPTSPNSTVSINIPDGAATSLGGIPSAVLTEPFKVRFDDTKPAPLIALPGISNNDSVSVTIGFRERVRGDLNKLTASNGVISNLVPVGNNAFRFTLTPTVRGQTTTVTMNSGFATDVAGNSNESTTASILFVATNAPALIPKLTSFESTSTNLTSVPFTVDFGTPVNGLSATSFSITNGTVQGNVQHQGNGVYAFIVQPTAPGVMKVSLPANRVTDTANATRQNVASNEIALQFSATAPRPVITADNLTVGGTSSSALQRFTVTFSEPVDGFTEAEVNIIGGTIANFAGEQSQPLYTFDVIPSGTGLITVEIPQGVAKNVDLVDNLASAPFTFQSQALGDVIISVDSDPVTVAAGADTFYLISVKNIGFGTVNSVNVTATLPGTTTYVPITRFLSDDRVSANGQNLSINVGDLAAGATQYFTVQIKTSQSAAVNSTQSITFNVNGGNDSDLNNNSTTFAKTVIAGSASPIRSATVKDATNGGDVIVSVPDNSGATISNLVSTPILSLPPDVSAALPFGVDIAATSFNINVAVGGEVVVTLSPPEGVPSNAWFAKYGKLPGATAATVYEFMFDGKLGAKLFPDRIEIHLKDGERGDSDGEANGVIVDPGFVLPLNPFAPYQSTSNPLDVNSSGTVTTLDALAVINELNRNGAYTLPTVVPMPVTRILYWDTNGNGSLGPIDALLVINALNRIANGSGEFDEGVDQPLTTSSSVEEHSILLPSATSSRPLPSTNTNLSRAAQAQSSGSSSTMVPNLNSVPQTIPPAASPAGGIDHDHDDEDEDNLVRDEIFANLQL